jgi:trimeric autotransporter adhesin
MKSSLLFILAFFTFQCLAQAQIITTVAGGGTGGLGDGGQATAAELYAPTGVAVDVVGNLYITDRENNRIRKINTSGIITTIAGTGVAGYTGDGGPATLATLNKPYGIILDAAGNILFSEVNNSCIRKISTDGIISTVAGTGVGGYNGDGIPATAAQLSGAGGIAIDISGNIYISDLDNHRIRKVTPSGEIVTIAGTGIAGYSGNNGPATAAQLNEPQGVALDGVGNIYFTDFGNNRIRKIDLSGTISTIAGGSSGYSGDGGPATAAKLRNPIGICVSATSDIYFTEAWNHCVREINTSGIINTIAGTGAGGFAGDGFAATTAKLQSPTGVTIDAYGNLYIADWGNNRIRTLKVPTMVPEVGKAKARLLLYPNPSDGNFSVSVSTDRIEEVEIVVIDVLGKIVLRESGKSNSTIPVSVAQGAGTYFVHAVTSGGEQHSEVVVVR